jgi:hypothetical protein
VRSRNWLADSAHTPAKSEGGSLGEWALDVGGDGGNPPELTRSPAPQYPNLLVPDPGKPDRALTTAEMEGTVRRQGAFLPNPASSSNAKRPPGQAGQALDVGGDGGNRRSLALSPPKSPVSKLVSARPGQAGSGTNNRGDGGI